MKPAEKGFLLLTSHLGDLHRDPLTVAQLRELAKRVRAARRSAPARQMRQSDLMELGYSPQLAARILELLSQKELLELYMHKANRAGLQVLTRASEEYPLRIRKLLGGDCPGCLWLRGDTELLQTPMIALVGSRELRPDNRAFASEVGIQAAKQGYTLVSGNARGADIQAQESCLAAGGSVISVVADRLQEHPQRERVLYISEDSYDLPFSAARALSRNRVIHCLAQKTFVAQSSLEKGGTWDGTVKNLNAGWSSVFCFDDGSAGAQALGKCGAALIGGQQLDDIFALKDPCTSMLSDI